MDKFLQRLAVFFFMLLAFFAIALLVPATPRASTSMLFAKIQKDSLLENVKSPRIILIGGSSMSMSVDSEKIKDSLGLNPVNTGVHAAIGLVFMLDHTIKYVRKGDVIVIAPEYDQFNGNFAYGAQELLRTYVDLKSKDLDILRFQQVKNMMEYVPTFAISKLKPSEYKKSADDAVYLRDAFNEYGDCSKRLPDHGPNTLVFQALSEPFNPDMIQELKNFEKKANDKGAKVILTFPAFQEASYNNSAAMIKQVEKAYHSNGFTIIGNALEYRFPNELMYDTPYHLTTKGIEIRTQMLIKELLYEAHLKHE
ncbi:MAG TPA: hypothetical protein VK476_03310 [Flavobacterium sp.]|nr:hypothetical protein [Flavobacterium sp.]